MKILTEKQYNNLVAKEVDKARGLDSMGRSIDELYNNFYKLNSDVIELKHRISCLESKNTPAVGAAGMDSMKRMI